jgi:hypothetical protein
MSEKCLVAISFDGGDDSDLVWYSGIQDKAQCFKLKKMMKKIEEKTFTLNYDRIHCEINYGLIDFAITDNPEMILAFEKVQKFTRVYGNLDFKWFYDGVKDEYSKK